MNESGRTLTLNIFRFDPQVEGDQPRMQRYQLPESEGMLRSFTLAGLASTYARSGEVKLAGARVQAGGEQGGGKVRIGGGFGGAEAVTNSALVLANSGTTIEVDSSRSLKPEYQ